MSRSSSYKETCRLRRLEAQAKGRARIKLGEPLYVAGCMLYWGEGSKNINSCRLVNSELPMILMFKEFLRTSFEVPDELITIDINAYTDLHSEEEIKSFWLKGLGLSECSLKTTLFNQYPTSSKKKSRKSEFGTCTLSVNKTEIVQEIFGAIQEFGNFTNNKWLDHK